MELKKKDTLKILVISHPNALYKKFLETIFKNIEIEYVVFHPDNFQPCNLILLTGGADVNPRLYKQPVGQYTFINLKRDELENLLVTRYDSTPKLGICRGAQFLTVMSGGKLIQHVNGHNNTHTIQTGFDMPAGHFKSYVMSSSHHQMMYPYNLKENRFNILAWSEYYHSTTYLDGKDKEINIAEDFLECEIVHYKNTNSLCIQGHPEYSGVPTETVKLVKKLINEFLIK
tara:strand:+ start:24285 stop:24974 length:690 start_codon:yes stop_codon:yes gene_type:complete